MFVRKKKNKSGSISIQVITKKRGRYQVVKSFGSTYEPERLVQMEALAKQYIEKKNEHGQLPLLSLLTREDIAVKNAFEQLHNLHIHTIGPEIIFGTLFDRIGFNNIGDVLFRHIVIARLAFPVSKLKTVDYLYRYSGITIDINQIYRFLDKLSNRHKEEAEKVAFEYTKKQLRSISIVFYDMTTLYFETEDEDDLRKIGFSKDGKFQQPQVMIGLLVGQNGYPIGYDVFEGNTFEGHTLLPILENIQKKYGFEKPVVVADAALLSKDNLEKLANQEYQFIIGARIKNETKKTQEEILQKAREIIDGGSFIIKRPDGTRLIVTYSDNRRKKDACNRERGLKKLKQKIGKGKLTKESINNRGYNKFLHLKGQIDIEIDEDKVAEDQKWDGLKGYITNTKLRAKKVVENYSHLWQLEKAFRISKTDLRIRPIYHYRKRRIEAHICIAFVAYTIYKELERLLRKHKAPFSPARAAELTHNMYQIEYTFPHAAGAHKVTLKMNDEQQILHDAIYYQ